MVYQSALPSWNIQNKRIFLRADLNIPLIHKTIKDDYKLQSILPTINLILEKKGKIILASHIDRPTHPQTDLSTRQLLPWFVHHGYSIEFCETIERALDASKLDSKTIVLLENLRFFPGEKGQDPQFAHELKKLADFYVNDAFGALHRQDCSVYALPQLFSPEDRTLGLLVEKELNNAQKLTNPERPFCVIIGGGKAADKIPLIHHLLPKIDVLLLCPAVDQLFYQNENQEAQKIISYTKKHQIAIELPEDYLIGKSLETGPFTIKKKEELLSNDFPICIGPQTQKKYAQIISQSKTAFYNGLMGTVENMQTLEGVYPVFTAMQQCNYALVGGGDSTAAARILGFENKLNLSSGGAALLAYLSGQKLPALEMLTNRTKT